MEFNEALQKSLKADKHTHADPFHLLSHVCDLVGNDFEAKKAAEEFYRLDAKYEISKTILGSAPVRYKKRKSIIINSNRYRYHPITHTFTLIKILQHYTYRENAPASRVLHKFTELLTTTPKCLISREYTFLTALGFTRCCMVGAFQGYHKAIKCISATVAEILSP